MRRVILVAGLALLVGVFLSGSALSDVGGSNLPYKASASGSFTLNLVTGQGQVVSTSANSSHFGLATIAEDAQFVPTGPGTFDAFYSQTLTAANGDQVFTSGVGTSSTPDGVHFTALVNYVSSGGTGRFAGASLTYAATIHATVVSVDGVIATGHWDATSVGKLSYR